MNPHFFTAPLFEIRERVLMVRRVLWVQKVQRGLCGTFRHPERRKTSYVKKWLI